MNILLVDDDGGIIQVMLPVLKSIPGAEVRVAITGEKALEHAAALGKVDVLVTDVVMEPMNGFTLRNKLENRSPDVRTIFISGYDLSSYAEHVRGCRILTKPFTPDALLRAIEREQRPPEPVQAPAPQTIPKVVTHGTAVPVATAMPSATAANPSILSGPALVGRTLGQYKIIRLLGEGKWGAVYEALQTSMNRPVALKVLSPKLHEETEALEEFIVDAQAKANVQHPLILSVYEAGETGPYCYYAIEYVDGLNLSGYIQQNRTVDDSLALQLLRVAAEGSSFLNQNKISHSPIEPSHLYIGADNRPRLANLATQHESHPGTQREITSLAQIIRKVLPNGRPTDPGLQALLRKMGVSGNEGFLSWGALLQAVKALEPKVIPVDAFKMSAQDVVAIRAVEESKRRQRRSILLYIVVSFGLLFLIFYVAWRLFFPSNMRDFEKMVKIPGGEFIYQNGQKVNLPTFWIDQYEVTLGQYGQFLHYLKKHPDEAAKFDDSKQPKGKSHIPKNWETWYGRAGSKLPAWRNAQFIPIDLNCPVFGVDWWDAYAYAKWKHRRLPTEQEWEKAARGPGGNLYPWGNEFDPKKCNSAADYNEDPRVVGKIDGYNRWSPVDAISGDCSPYKVYGMAGNLAEWTASWDSSGKFPVVRGGSYHSVDEAGKPDVKVTKRIATLYPDESNLYVGFRTASSEPPTKK